MKLNVGGVDRTGRIVIGILLLVAGLVAPISMAWRTAALVVAAVALVTAAIRFCPANAMLGINTFEGKNEESK